MYEQIFLTCCTCTTNFVHQKWKQTLAGTSRPRGETGQGRLPFFLWEKLNWLSSASHIWGFHSSFIHSGLQHIPEEKEIMGSKDILYIENTKQLHAWCVHLSHFLCKWLIEAPLVIILYTFGHRWRTTGRSVQDKPALSHHVLTLSEEPILFLLLLMWCARFQAW